MIRKCRRKDKCIRYSRTDQEPEAEGLRSTRSSRLIAGQQRGSCIVQSVREAHDYYTTYVDPSIMLRFQRYVLIVHVQ